MSLIHTAHSVMHIVKEVRDRPLYSGKMGDDKHGCCSSSDHHLYRDVLVHFSHELMKVSLGRMSRMLSLRSLLLIELCSSRGTHTGETSSAFNDRKGWDLALLVSSEHGDSCIGSVTPIHVMLGPLSPGLWCSPRQVQEI